MWIKRGACIGSAIFGDEEILSHVKMFIEMSNMANRE